MLHFRSKPLPEIAEEFLKEFALTRRANTVSLYRAGIHHFYRFLLQSKIKVTELTGDHFVLFDEDLERHNLRLVTRQAHIGHIHLYLRWLEKKELILVGTCQKLFPNYRSDLVIPLQSVLPELAERFLEVLGSSCKPNTVNGYKSCLRAFYLIHHSKNKLPYKIERQDVEDFMLHLSNKKMGPNERFGRLVQFRRYLDWLFDHKKLKIHPDKLLTSKDFPQRDETLPKPFAVDIDIEIQRRLWESTDIDRLGVLLMRRTGLRVGELRNLTLDCIMEDFNYNWFLKVPLGKLHNERVIPLDPKTIEVVEKIKLHHKNRPEKGTNIVYLISNPSGKRRSTLHFGKVLADVTRGLAIPGKVNLHRLRHSYATSLLSAGLSITTLKKLMGHKDIRMTLGYAAVTQETIRNEYFEALSKVQSKYEVASYPLKVPDNKFGMNRSFYDAQKYAKKMAKDIEGLDKKAFNRLCYRLMTLRNDFVKCLGLEEQNQI